MTTIPSITLLGFTLSLLVLFLSQSVALLFRLPCQVLLLLHLLQQGV